MDANSKHLNQYSEAYVFIGL